MAEWAPKNLTDLSFKIKTVNDAVLLGKKSLNQLGKDYAKRICIAKFGMERIEKMTIKQQNQIIKEHFPDLEITAYIKVWIIDLISNINAKQSLSGSQIDYLARRLYSLYSWKIPDLLLFFRNIKDGLYGPLFENISPDKIIDFAAIFQTERAGAAESISEQKNQKFIIGKDKMHPEVLKKMFAGVGEDDKKTPEILEVRKSYFLDSDKGFIAYLENACKATDEETLVDLVKAWVHDNSLVCYLHILGLELRSRNESTYKSLCEAVVDFQKKNESVTMNASKEIIKEVQNLKNSIINF